MSIPLLPKDEMVVEMCRRVNLPLRIGNRIFALALEWSFHSNHPVDMILVAQAISYAGKNKHLLKEQYKR
jgi:4-hydroxy-3-methylbut-2-en-1-yl diphosphate synthase IspG/GcpE